MRSSIALTFVGTAWLSACSDTGPNLRPPGAAETAETRMLEAGAAVLQTHAPLGPMNVYLVGFHPMKDAPENQVEAHHFCTQVNEDFAQCALFDGNERASNLNGIEYIISERLFERLPESERPFWHPHNYEILSGQLAAPGIPGQLERRLMQGKMNSYGKTWHVWNTGSFDQPGDELPLGEPMLAWSFNRDGEARPGLVEQRDERMGVDSAAKRRERQELVSLASPQSGVDDLAGAFPRDTQELAGVVDERTATARADAPQDGEAQQ
jgi:hypothetical protein